MEREAYTSEFLDYLWQTAQSDNLTLENALKNASHAQIERTSSGLVLTGVSGNNASSNFSFLKTITPGQIIEIIHVLKKIYKLAVSTLSSELEDGETLTDLAIYNWMSDHIEDLFVEGEIYDYSGRVL